MNETPDRPLGGLNPVDLLRQGAEGDSAAGGGAGRFPPPSLGELAGLFPHFEILELIGQGGMGAVYKARQKRIERVVALKILPPSIGESAEFSERFTREAKALAKLNHPNIVTLYEFGQAEGLYFIVMEYVDGVNLGRLMRGERISCREALAIVPRICDALQFAHDQGIVHRDVKPENILLDRRGQVKVADFGLAMLMTGEREPEGAAGGAGGSRFTEAGKVMGTPDYMAPEQKEHPAEVDHRADIYALGVVFYQMLTGELPGGELRAAARRLEVDVRLNEIVIRAMERNPELRFRNAEEMKTRIEESMKTEDGEGRRWNGRWLAVAAAVAGVAAVALFLRKEEVPRADAGGAGEVAAVPEVVVEEKIRVSVLGKVARSGLYSLRREATLLEAMAAAGGWSGEANPRKISVSEGGSTERSRIVIHDLNAILQGRAVNPGLRDGDVIVVPERNF